MESKHWTDVELLELLYGVGRDRDAHLSRCPACLDRWGELRLRREGVLGPVTLPQPAIARQKQNILARLTRSRERNARFLSPGPLAAFAIAALLLVAIVFRAPTSNSQPAAVSAPAASADAKLFTEVMYEASRTGPAALTPMEGLFESQAKAVHP